MFKMHKMAETANWHRATYFNKEFAEFSAECSWAYSLT